MRRSSSTLTSTGSVVAAVGRSATTKDGSTGLLPVLGAFVVWIPAALFLALEGNWEKALILAVWGAVVVGGIDNLLRPMLLGDRLKLHTIVAFISVVGGLLLLGPAGLILGPVALTITTELLEVWQTRRQGQGGADCEIVRGTRQ